MCHAMTISASPSLFCLFEHISRFNLAFSSPERGLISDARVVLRSGVEGAIALNALANEATFLDVLIEAHYYNQRKTANVILSDPAYGAEHSPQQIAEMQATIADVNAREQAVTPRNFDDPNWANVAQKHCKDLYILYRLFSSDGPHTTINAIHRRVAYDANQQISELDRPGYSQHGRDA
jgi:hypothetical protein